METFYLKYGGTKLYFGVNAIKNLEREVSGIEHATIVTGKQSARRSGALDDIKNILKEKNIEYDIFDRIKPNPTVEMADELAEYIWKKSSDCMVAVGGGSIIDTAKVSSVIALSGGCAKDYLKGKTAKRSLPLYAVNLTHGTGSEIDRFAVLTDGIHKIGISSRYPDVSIDDPRYTLTLPENQTIFTSIDAFFHAYEAVTARTSNKFVETLSIESAKLIGESLPKEQTIEEKEKLLYASMIAGISLDMSPAHIVHAIEHALSGLNPELPHGCGLAIVGARSIYWIHRHSENSGKILQALLSKKIDSPEDAEKSFREFLRSVGFEETLDDYGFSRDDFRDVEKILFEDLKYFLKRVDFKFTPEMLHDVLEKSL